MPKLKNVLPKTTCGKCNVAPKLPKQCYCRPCKNAIWRENHAKLMLDPEYRASEALKGRLKRNKNIEQYKRRFNEYQRAYDQRPHIKAKNEARRRTPEYIAKRRARWKNRYNNNIQAKLMHLQRAYTYQLRKRGNDTKYRHLFGCSLKFLVQHLESQFTKAMSWDNHGSYWQIDHIQPLSKFDLTQEYHCKLAWNWQNLRPLPQKENREKWAKITVPQLVLPLALSEKEANV